MALTIPSTPIAAAATSVTIPTHSAGDLLIIGAYDNAATTAPTKPAAGGTVPTWTAIDNPIGANLNGQSVMWALAAGSTDTSGTWASTTHMVAIVVRGQHATPVGAHIQSGGAAASSCVGPALTLNVTDGSSLVFSIIFHKSATAWGASPAGWTQQLASTTGLCVVLTLNSSLVSPSAVTQTDTSANGGYRGETLELIPAIVVSSGANSRSLLGVGT